MAKFVSDLMKEVQSTIAPAIRLPSSKSQSLSLSTLSSTKANTALAVFATTACFTIMWRKGIVNLSSCVGAIYDKIIVNMTEKWYRNVLEKQKNGSTILDVGIGTAGALLRCKDILIRKNLNVIGIDYNNLYIEAARTCIHDQQMADRISVHTLSIYDEEGLQSIMSNSSSKLSNNPNQQVDSVYFSGSFSLLPDPVGALAAVLKVLKPKGEIYITQTYQKKSSAIGSRIKPLLKFVTTIDFGQLITVREIGELLNGLSGDGDGDGNGDGIGLEVKEHAVIEGSVDNFSQAAYVSVLVRKGSGYGFGYGGGGKVDLDGEKKKKGIWAWF